MNHLNDLLDDVSAGGPVDRLDLDDVITAGRSRVRRRRAVAGVATAAVVGLGAVFVLPGGESGPQPARPAQVTVLTLGDAVTAEEGRDYQVLDEFSAHADDQSMDGDFVRGVLPDGTVVLQRYPNGRDFGSEIVTINPGGTRVFETPGGLGNYLGASDRYLVFGGAEGLGLLALDRENGDVRALVTDKPMLDPNMPIQPLTAEEEHVYVAGAGVDDRDVRPIYDVNLAPKPPTEIARGGAVAAYAGRVAWTDAHDAAVRTVTVRDRDGETSFDPNTGDCIGKGIGITDQRVVVMANCQDGVGDSEYTDIVTRIDVFDLDGNPLARITDDDGFGPVRMSDRFLTLSSWEADRAGTYTYDLETERFLRVTDEMSELAGNETGAGSTVVWEERLDGDTGATYVVAEMR